MDQTLKRSFKLMNSRQNKSIIFIVILHLTLCVTISAQLKPTGTLSGKVFDKSTSQPLEYATISLLSKQSGKIITGTVSDAKGAFVISNIPFDTYQVNIEFIGYEKITLDNITIKSDRRSVSVGTVSLSSATHNLESVIVMGDKPVVENKIDKIVYNVSNDITSQGGAAIDVLKKVPQVTVDIDGNVELQGNSNIRFLINGKPSSVFGNSLADALASIPASQIKSVEAITNPGAKYDSQGTGGIINIILYDNKMQGVNGNINLSAGSRLENGSMNLNIRHNNFGVNAFFSGNAALKSEMPYSQNRFATDTSAKTITNMLQTSRTDFIRNGFRSGVGFDWNITKNDIITGSLGYNQFSNSNQGLTNQEQLMTDYSYNPLSDVFTFRNSDSRSRVNSIDYSLDYKRKFKNEGQELDIVYNASNGRPYSTYIQSQSYEGQMIPFSGSSSTNPGTDNETNLSIDYAHPVNKNFLIETGAKMGSENITSLANVSVLDTIKNEYLNDASQSYSLNYKMNVYAGYLSANFKLSDWLNIKLGARYEYTQVKIDLSNTTIPSYGTFVPSIVLSHDFNKSQSLKLAYGKRIERPDYRDLNPFINLSDPYNISTGNPLLKPEIGNNFELGYSNTFKKGGNIYISLIERINTSDIKSVTTFYPTYLIGDSTYTNISVNNRQNIGEEYNTGISASGSYPVTTKLNLRGNLMVLHRYTVNYTGIGDQSSGVRVRFNMNATYQLNKDLVFELFGFYSSATQNIQGKTPQFFMYNFALRKLFWDKKASFGFTATNPFNKYVRQLSTISAESYTSTTIRMMPLRSFGISFMYKFGKMEFNKKKEEDNSNFMNETSP
jgi:outer membrane receptor protein involved in Fe transport